MHKKQAFMFCACLLWLIVLSCSPVDSRFALVEMPCELSRENSGSKIAAVRISIKANMPSTHPAASHYARRSTIGLPMSIQGVDIRTDAAGRYCLNDLHRAAGGQAKDQPAFFIRRRETADLVAELSNTGNPHVSAEPGASANSQTPVATLNDGRNNGTYVVKELVYAYAMWISPSFHLKVIRAFDDLVTGRTAPVFNIPQTLPEALRLAADLADKNASLSHRHPSHKRS